MSLLSKISLEKIVPLVPYVFSLFIVTNFFSANPNVLTGWSFSISFGIVAVMTAVSHIATLLLLKDKVKAVIFTVFFLIIFFSYSVLNQVLMSLLNNRILDRYGEALNAAIFIIFLVFIFMCLKRSQSDLKIVSLFLVVFVCVLNIMPIVNLLKYFLFVTDINNKPQGVALAGNTIDKDELPDIYHIVLDGYGREDVLQEYYDLDNSNFVKYLDDKGFIVRDDCWANYLWTTCSVASMLGMNYLPNIDTDYNMSQKILCSHLEETGVGKILEGYSYEYIEVSSPVPTDDSADIMNMYENSSIVIKYWLSWTPMRHLFKYSALGDDIYVYDYWRQRTLDTYNKIEAIPGRANSPVYVYCHILACHPPFVFSSQGESLDIGRPFSFADGRAFISVGGTDKEYRENYKQQLLFTNSRVKNLVDNIMSKTQRPTIIIISSDHGPRLLLNQQSVEDSEFQESLPIFLAYRMPESITTEMAKVRTPVNIYRAILNHYFDTGYDILPDQSFYALWHTPLDCREINPPAKINAN